MDESVTVHRIVGRGNVRVTCLSPAGCGQRRVAAAQARWHPEQQLRPGAAIRMNQPIAAVVKVAITPAAARREARDTEGCSAATSVRARTDLKATG